MKLVENFSVSDYLALYQNRNDYYHATCLRRANQAIFRKFRFVVFILIFSAGASLGTFWLLNAANNLADKVDKSTAKAMNGMLLLQQLPADRRAALLQEMTAGAGAGGELKGLDIDALRKQFEQYQGQKP